jgi:hypothetical protein
MTFTEAQAELIRHRNLALVQHGNSLLARGMKVQDEDFRTSMLNYGWDLEVWRMAAMEEIASAIGLMTSRSAARH